MRRNRALFFALAFFSLSQPIVAQGERQDFYYTVKEGDTLYEISRQFLGEPFFYPRIARVNNLADSDLIFPGQRLLIPLRNSYRCRELVLAEKGDATYYNLESAGKTTRSGELFDPQKFTAASNTLELGTIALVTNIANGKSVVVRINDTGGFTPYGIVIDLSEAAFAKIAPLEQGRIEVGIRVLNPKNQQGRVDNFFN